MSEHILEIEHLVKEYTAPARLFEKKQAPVRALDDVTFQVNKGESYGIVGESGCGKTTLGKCITRLHLPSSGTIRVNLDGQMRDIRDLNKKESKRLHRDFQMVFQDPYASLNPMHNIFEAFDEPLRVHGMGNKVQRQEIIANMLETVNLRADYMYRFPHEFSGGQRQRICIAKALAMQPQLVVCDEPVSALDVSIQAQIMNLMRRLQKEYNLTYIFIAHDLSVVQYMCDRIMVMYLGQVVECAESYELWKNSIHPYTKALFSAVPVPVYNERKTRILLPGDVPSPASPPSGCRFHTRCHKCTEICKMKQPELKDMGNGHLVACHHYE